MRKTFEKVVISLTMAGLIMSSAGVQNVKSDEKPVTKFVDCFEPMPIIGGLNDDCWGAENVGPRDQDNGLEDRTMGECSYWDGGVIKGDDGKYYMFGSRWSDKLGFEGWAESQAVYAVSDNLYGPYEDKGVLWPDYCDGAGHNVFPYVLCESDPLYQEGYRYAVSVSDVHKGVGFSGYSPANGSIHIAKDISGPWELVDNGNNGIMKTSRDMGMVNVSVAVNPQGGYVAINRYGDIATADSLADEWTVHVKGLWSQVPGMPESAKCVEDAVTWYSNGMFHIVVNKWDARIAYYLTSENGIDDWQLRTGAAYTPDNDFLKYEDGTVNNWYKVERPNVYIEDGSVKAMIFAVVDCIKEKDYAGDQHGSKIIVVPFSAEKLEYLATHDDPLVSRPGGETIADTSLVTGNADTNFGDCSYMYLRNDTKFETGLIGDGSFTDEANHKLGLVKYDLAQCLDGNSEKIDKAYLSLVYLSEEDEGDPNTIWVVDDEAVAKKRDQIRVVLADSDWEENSVTANTQPKMLYDANNPISAVSDVFIPTSGGVSEVKIDVTNLVKEYLKENPQAKTISFALNETADGYDLRLGTKETGPSFSSRLSINTIAETKPTDKPTDKPSTEIEKKQPVTEPNVQQVPTQLRYNVIYQMNSGINSNDNPNTYLHENVTLKSPSRKGYRFKGWYTDAGFTNKISVIEPTTTGDLYLYAKWQKVNISKVKIKSLKKLKNGKSVKVKVSGKYDGYEFVYGTDKKLKKGKVLKSKKSSVIITLVNSKKINYIKVRAYSKDSTGDNVFGKYSKLKKIAVKK